MTTPSNRPAPARSSRADRSRWFRQRFVDLGREWYDQPAADLGRTRELEDEAVQLLRDHADVVPSLSALQRDVRRVSFLPSTVEDLWTRAFPPTVDDRARARTEWQLLNDVGSRVRALAASGDAAAAEALRRSAVTFFNQWLATDDDVDARIRREARALLRKA